MDQLFSDNERTSFERHLDSESLMHYFERSAKDDMAIARMKIQALYDLYVSEASKGELQRIRGSLFGRNDNDFFAAYFELFVFNYLKSLNLNVSIAPNLENNEKRNSQPDFKLIDRDGICYVEATVLNEKEGIPENASAHLEIWFKDQFEILRNVGFDLHVHCEGNQLYHPSLIETYSTNKALYEKTKKWHNSLDHASYRKQIDAKGKIEIADRPQFVGYVGNDPYDYIKVVIEAWPMSFESIERNAGHKVQVTTRPIAVSVSADLGKIVSKCKKKISQHNSAEMYIAIDMRSVNFFTWSILSDLYGHDRISWKNSDQIDLSKLNSKEDSIFIRKNGEFRNAKVKGVLIFYDIYPWAPGHEKCDLFLNPIFDQEFTPLLRADRIFRRFGDVMKFDHNRAV